MIYGGDKLMRWIQVIFVGVLVAAGLGWLSSYFFQLEGGMNRSGWEVSRVEKQGRLTIFSIEVSVQGVESPVRVRVVVSREESFRVSRGVQENFSPTDVSRIAGGEIFWINDGSVSDSWLGIFLAYDGDVGYINNSMRSYRVYRKHLNQHEVDYVFDSQGLERVRLGEFIQELDKKIFEAVRKSGGFEK